jgi:hypothetical protein
MHAATSVFSPQVIAHGVPALTVAETISHVPRKRLELRARVQRRQERHALWTLRRTTGRDWLARVFGSRPPYRRVRR